MAVRFFSSKPKTINTLFSSVPKPLLHSLSQTFTSLGPNHSEPPLTDLVNEISRTLSDNRSPHHDLELRLTSFSPVISPLLVDQVLKRCKNIGFSAHRFFQWAKGMQGFEPSDESYHILVDILGSSKQFALLWDLLIEMRETRCSAINQKIFWIVFRSYSRADLPADAIRAFNRIMEFGIKPTCEDLNHLLYDLCKRKHITHAHEFFQKIKSGFEPSLKTYSILMSGWAGIGKSQEARNLFDEMLERGCVVDVTAYNCLMQAMCKEKNVDEAYKIFREMGSNGINPDACTFSIFIRTYCEADDIHSAFRVLDRMRRHNVWPNTFTYNCIIQKLCENTKVEEAYQVLDEMINGGVNPNQWSYNTIQAYHCNHCEVTMALRLIARMERENCMPDRHSYNMVLKMLIRVGRFDKANEVWESMGRRGFYPSVSTYAVMVHGFCKKKGKVEEACNYFEMMIDEGIPPYSSTVGVLRSRLLEFGLSDLIEILIKKMEQSTSCSVQELANLMRGCKVNVSSISEETEVDSRGRIGSIRFDTKRE